MTTLSEYRLNPYPQYLWVVFSDNPEEAYSKITRKIRRTDPTSPHFKTLAPEDNERCLAFVSSYNNVHIAFFNIFPDSSKQDSILEEPVRAHLFSHEALHVVSKAFLACGIHYDPENDEPAAYLLSYIVSCMYTEWMDVKDKFPSP